ncbi:MAG: TIM barrel protein [Elusimicrobiota bacterium]
MLSISTVFAIKRCPTWQLMLDEALKCGFSSVELGVQVPESWLQEIERSVKKGEIAVSSLHNYVPMLTNLPPNRHVYSGYFLTSYDENESRLAVDLTRRTIKWAGRLGAKAIVAHAGEVPTDPTGRNVFEYAAKFSVKGKLYSSYTNSLFEDRVAKTPKYMDALQRNLEAVLETADAEKVCVALENRVYANEVPDMDETLFLLKKFKGSPLGYWHDAGHGEIFARMGFVDRHESILETLGTSLIGMHLHDLKGLDDHFTPGFGDFEFGILKPYAKNGVLKVIETHKYTSPEELKKGIKHLNKAGIA